MDMTDDRLIAAPQALVWDAIRDADVLRQAIPGCLDLSGDADSGYDATVTQKVGPVKATFKGRVTVTDSDPPHALTLTGEGKGGAAGFAKGSARITLTPEEGGTRIAYTVEAKVGGKLAQLGGRVIDGVAKRLAEQFFETFQQAVEAPEGSADTIPDAAPEAQAPEARAKGWFRRLRAG